MKKKPGTITTYRPQGEATGVHYKGRQVDITDYRYEPDGARFDLDAMYADVTNGNAVKAKTSGFVPARKACFHYGEDSVFVAGGREFFGAQGHHANPALYDVVLDCAGAVAKPFLMTASARFRQIASPNHFLRFHWPDRKAPPVAPQWWVRLARALPKRGRILVACIGSHGRTGTALALLALATGRVETAEEAIKLVRVEHCARAVECKEQEDYIAAFARYLEGSK